MRVAIFSDTHGNSIALDAVLSDIDRVGGVDAHWFVGDAAMIGFDPVATVRRLTALPELVAARGNGDRRLATEPARVREIAERFVATASPSESAIWRSVLADYEWTRDQLRQHGLFDWLAALPLEQRLSLPDGAQVLMVHASPGTDEGPGIHAGLTDAEQRAMAARAEADLVIVGHTHRPLDRTVDGVRLHNLGSVSNPPRTDKRAMWTLLDANEQGYSLARQYAAYDLDAVRQRLTNDQVPAWEHILGFFETA